MVKKVIAIMIVAMLCFSIVACATPDAAPADPSGGGATDSAAADTNAGGAADSGTAAAPAEVTRERTLVWTVPQLPPGHDLHRNAIFQTMELNNNIFQTALIYPPIQDPDGSGFLIPDFNNPIGALAESWDVSDDGLTVTVKLKEGLLSSHGNELTADDWVYNVNRHTILFGVDGWVNNSFRVSDPDTQYQVLDRYTFSITTENPNPIALAMLAHPSVFMIDSVAYAEFEGDPLSAEGARWSTMEGAGHGAYVVDTWTPGDNVVLVPNPNYWNTDAPRYFEKVIYQEVPSSSSRLALVLSGDADAATGLTPAELREAEGHPGVKAMSWRSNILTRIGFNNTIEPFNDPEVRRALMFAVPYDEILETVYMGTATQMRSIVPSAYPLYTGEFFNFELDYDRAKELLAEAGWADGFSTTLTYETGIPQFEQIAIIVRDSLSNIGIDVTLENVQPADFWSIGYEGAFAGMYIFQDMPGTVDGAFAYNLWLQEGIRPNFCRYYNEEAERLFVEAMSTIDQGVRARNITRIQEITVWEDPAWILIAEPGFHLVVREEIEGLAWNTLQQIIWAHAYRR